LPGAGPGVVLADDHTALPLFKPLHPCPSRFLGVSKPWVVGEGSLDDVSSLDTLCLHLTWTCRANQGPLEWFRWADERNRARRGEPILGFWQSRVRCRHHTVERLRHIH